MLILRLARIGEHELDAVFLVDSGSARIVVNGNQVDVRVRLLDGLHHPFAYDVIGQTSKGLGDDHVAHAFVDQL